MLCEICKKNEATIHITRIINSEKNEMNICEKCAKEVEGLNFKNELMNDSSPFAFQNILTGIVDYINQTNNLEKSKELACEVCGNTYAEFKKTGLLGCSQCYKSFKQTVIPIVKRVQLNVEHTGKIPKKIGKDIIERKRLIRLKEELQSAIVCEEYEKAAQLRDEIKSIKKALE